MSLAIIKTVDSLNTMFGEIYKGTAQVSQGAVQIADGAENLAQGASEQAVTIELLVESITQVAGKTKESSLMAGKATQLAQNIKSNAEKGSEQMQSMLQAVQEIDAANQSISKVIKVIDDIAFQTNILALNCCGRGGPGGSARQGLCGCCR